MSEFILQEHKSDKYGPRTYHNANSADLTVAFAVDLNTAGEVLTHKAAGDRYIGFKLDDESTSLDLARELYRKMKSMNAKTLNIAGNGIYTLSKYKCSQEFINEFVYDVLSRVHEHWKIEKIVSGGQTGVDIAGAVAAKKLNIPAVITFPKGFIQRFEDKRDITQTKEDIEKQIDHWVACLDKTNEKKPKNSI